MRIIINKCRIVHTPDSVHWSLLLQLNGGWSGSFCTASFLHYHPQGVAYRREGFQMFAYRVDKALLVFSVFILPVYAHAQNWYQDSTSMDILASNNAPARACFQAASIAARIHYTSRKDIDTCTYALNRTAMTPRDRAATLANRGIIYMALEDYQKAIQDYTTALALKPEFGELNVNIGNVYYLGNAFDKAVTEYTTALEKNTSKPHIAHFNRGMAYESLGNYVSAEADFKTALQMMPDWLNPQLKLDQLKIKMQNPALGTKPPSDT